MIYYTEVKIYCFCKAVEYHQKIVFLDLYFGYKISRLRVNVKRAKYFYRKLILLQEAKILGLYVLDLIVQSIIPTKYSIYRNIDMFRSEIV